MVQNAAMKRFSFVDVGTGPLRNHSTLADYGPITCTLAYEIYDAERSDEDTADFRDRAVEDWNREGLDHASAQAARVIGATFDGMEILHLKGSYWFLDDDDAHDLGSRFEAAIERLHHLLKLPPWLVLTDDDTEVAELLLEGRRVEEVEAALAAILPGALIERYASAQGPACAALDSAREVFVMSRVEDAATGEFLVEMAGPPQELERIRDALRA